jgi:hypothetical protein
MSSSKSFYKRRRINSTSYLVTCYEEFFLLWIRPTGETTVKKRILHSTSTVMRKSTYVAQHLCYKYLFCL